MLVVVTRLRKHKVDIMQLCVRWMCTMEACNLLLILWAVQFNLRERQQPEYCRVWDCYSCMASYLYKYLSLVVGLTKDATSAYSP